MQADLLEPVQTSDTKLMRAIDWLNARFARGTVKVSTGGMSNGWAMRQERNYPATQPSGMLYQLFECRLLGK